jgi:hypothetical protein
MLMVTVLLTVQHIKLTLMDSVNVQLVMLELLWEFVAHLAQDLENVHLEVFICTDYVFHQLFAVLTNIGVELNVFVQMVITELMVNVFKSNQH